MMDGLQFAAPKPVGIFSRVKDGITVYKGADGLRYLLSLTSNSYRDREDEAIATRALQEYVDAAWSVEGKCLPGNKALFWHDGDPIGDVVWVDTEGPFLLEVIKERPNRRIRLTTKGRIWWTTVKTVWDLIEQTSQKIRWGASHGFRYRDNALVDGVYKRIAKFESSILPLDAAANPYTFAGVINAMNKDKFLDELLKTPGLAEKFRRGIRAVKQDLDKRGLEHKATKDQVTKGIMDNLGTAIDAFLAKISDSPDPSLKDQLMQSIVQAMATGAPDEPEAADEEYMEADDAAAAAAPVDENAAVLTGKQIKLLDTLIQSQKSLTESDLETRDMLGQVVKAIQPLAAVPGAVKSLDERLTAIEKRLSGAPRRAAADPATAVEDKDLTDKAKEQAAKYEELFPGSGIKLKPASGS